MRPVSLSLQNRLRRPTAAEKGLAGSPGASLTTSQASSATSTPIPFAATAQQSAQPHDAASGVKVFVRVRPFNEREKSQGAHLMAPVVKVDATEPSHITLLDPKHDMRPKETYTFDHCFWSVVSSNDTASPAEGGNWTPRPSQPTPQFASQADVYDLVGHSVLCNAIEGFNGCIFAYGQTGSGKTFTMMGYEPPNTAVVSTPLTRQPTSSTILPGGSLATSRRSSAGPTTPRGMTPASSEANIPGCEDWEGAKGIIPRIASEIFEALSVKHNGDSTHSFRVELQYYEIYNEKVYDLFEPSNSNELRVRQDPLRGPFVDQLTTKSVDNQDAIAKLIKKGSYERHTAATKANERSSRSHAVLTLTLVQMVLDENDCPQKMVSKVNLVDLAGSERTGLTGAEGQRFTEATKINLSLTTLGRVIDCLADQSTGKANGFTHCPYRESLLTWLLMDSIGGNSKTTMIATISPSALNLEEIVQTLRYASRARQIVNKVVVNEDPQTRRMKELAAEVERLNRIISEAQLCPYSIQFVSELEDNFRTAQGEMSLLRQHNANLRCEIDVLRTKKVKHVGSLEDDLGADQPSTREASPHHTRQTSQSASPLPSMVGHPIYADPTAAMPKRLFERSEVAANPSLQFTGSPMENSLRSRVRELTQAMQDMLAHRTGGLRRNREHPPHNAADTSIDSIASSSVSFADDPHHLVTGHAHHQHDPADKDEDIMSVEYVHMIEKLAQQLDDSECAFRGLAKTQMDVFHADMTAIREAVVAAEREQRDRLVTATSSVRSDIKTLIFRLNAATEKQIADKVKDAASRKHTAELQAMEERWEQRLADCKESFAAQIAEERASHEQELRVLKDSNKQEQNKVKSKEEERTRTGLDAQKTIEELQSKLDAAQVIAQKQVQHAKALHEKERKRWDEETEHKETCARDTMRIAIADAHAKGRVALEDMRKKKDAVAAERDCLAKRLAETEAELQEAVASAEAQKHALAKREKQLQDWQRSLQTVEARELHSVTEQLHVTTRAREASHARHESETDSTKAALELLGANHQLAMQHMQNTCAASVETLHNRVQQLSSKLALLRTSQSAAEEHRREEDARLEALNAQQCNEIECLRAQLLDARQHVQTQGQEVEDVRQQRAMSQSRHESEAQLQQQAHNDQVRSVAMQLEGQMQCAAAEHEAALKALAVYSDARVERLTAAIQCIEKTRSAEALVYALMSVESGARDAIVGSWLDSIILLITAHEQSRGRSIDSKTTLEGVSALLEASEQTTARQLELHTSSVDGMMSTMLSSMRQHRWHQESMLSDARDTIVHEMGKYKTALTVWAEAEQVQLASALEQLNRSAKADSQSVAGGAEEDQGRKHIERLAAHAWEDLCVRWASALQEATTAHLLNAYRDIQLNEWTAGVEALLVYQCQTTQELYQELHEDQTMGAEQREITATLRHQILTMHEQSSAQQAAFHELHRERDLLAETARSLELRLGEANLEVLEADLLCTQLKERELAEQQQRQSESQSNASGGGIVGSLVRRIWSVSQGRTAASAERENSSQPATPRKILMTQPQRLGLNFSGTLVGSLGGSTASNNTPRGVATPRRVPVIMNNASRTWRGPYSSSSGLNAQPSGGGDPSSGVYDALTPRDDSSDDLA